ncbi:uncharacterized protein EDB91DRAFT_1117628 [Suillus paluster]|uniref:uncharacterized protein n=1 Tax=Suillus paluster TaxID=48578 RepID=UPI001B886D80|nr:uncharacterized protein EDB91DRAFT_1117628 [Suillus paluster]KAG1746560.1 hypothetical protein EDB91DRAFT_1117628 [Suillus paluster]
MNSIEFSPAFLLGSLAELDPSFESLTPLKSLPPSRGLGCDISMDSMHTQFTLSHDFYLRICFEWMSNPHDFKFNPDEPIECQKTTPSTPASPPVSAKEPSETDVAVAKSVLSQGLCDKPWKNIAITEYDDAEFEELQARSAANEIADDGLVYTWPPDLAAYRREVEEERGSGDAEECADENVVPAIFRGASPTVSASTEDCSPMMSMPQLEDDDAQAGDVSMESLSDLEDGALEKVVGLERLRRKAPPPLCLGCKQAEHAFKEIGLTLLIDDSELTAREKMMLSPLTAGIIITSKLSAGVPRHNRFSGDLLSF